MPDTRPPCPFCDRSGYVWVVRAVLDYDAGEAMQRDVRWFAGDTYVHEALLNGMGHPDRWDLAANWQCLCTCENGHRIQAAMVEGTKRPDHMQLTGRYPTHDGFDRCQAVAEALRKLMTAAWGPSANNRPMSDALIKLQATRKEAAAKAREDAIRASLAQPRVPDYQVPDPVEVPRNADGIPFF